MSEAENPELLGGEQGITVEDIRALAGPATPHFSLQIRNRIARLIQGLPADHPARIEGEREISRLERLGFGGEFRGMQHEDGIPPLPSLDDAAALSPADDTA